MTETTVEEVTVLGALSLSTTVLWLITLGGLINSLHSVRATLWRALASTSSGVADHSLALGQPKRWQSPTSGRVLATILITDIVNSTQRAAQLGDRAWRQLLERHHTLVRREVARFGGREVRTTGDGFLVIFAVPARGIHCAAAIQEVVRQLGIEVRCGLHTGEIELMREDVGGIAVHISARVAAEAGPRSVLVSSTVKDLVSGSGIQFEDRGTRTLRGVPGEWRLFGVTLSR